MEHENLFFQWKCEVKDWGSNVIGLHLFYDFTDDTISGLSSTFAVTANQSQYYETTLNPKADKIIFNNTWLHNHQIRLDFDKTMKDLILDSQVLMFYSGNSSTATSAKSLAEYFDITLSKDAYNLFET